MVVLALLALSMSLLAVQGKDTCEIRGKGRLKQFNTDRRHVRLPCKYHASDLTCQGYQLQVVPGQAFDSKARYYTDTVWVSIRKVGTPHFWKGRTSNKRVMRYFENMASKTPFRTKAEDLDGASFNVQMQGDAKDYSVTLSVSDADFQVVFYAYDAHDKARRKKSGIKVICPEASYHNESVYPATLCGSNQDVSHVRHRKNDLELGTGIQTLIYDVLNNDLVTQTNPQCQTASKVFKRCNAGLRSEAVKICSNFLTHYKVVKCLAKYNFNAMDMFVYCLRYKCQNDSNSCDILEEALDGCPKVKVFLDGSKCPSSGTATLY